MYMLMCTRDNKPELNLHLIFYNQYFFRVVISAHKNAWANITKQGSCKGTHL